MGTHFGSDKTDHFETNQTTNSIQPWWLGLLVLQLYSCVLQVVIEFWWQTRINNNLKLNRVINQIASAGWKISSDLVKRFETSSYMAWMYGIVSPQANLRQCNRPN